MTKSLIRMAALALACSFASFGASPTLLQKGQLSGKVHFVPQTMPTSLTVVTPSDAYIVQIVIMATTAVTITVQDNQGSPIPIYPTFTSAAGTVYMAYFADGYYAPKGFSVQAGGAGVTYYASFFQ